MSSAGGAPDAATDPFRCVVEHCGDAFLLLDAEGRVLDANHEAGARYRTSLDELRTLRLTDLCMEPEAAAAVLGADEDACREGPLLVQGDHRRADGSTFPAELRAGLWPAGNDGDGDGDGHGTRRFVLVRDVSERGDDALTGLLGCAPFRRHLDGAVAAARASGGGLALLHVDLNRFALVNQAVGRDAGDALLCQVAGRLRDAVGSLGPLARLSADEFLLLLAGDGADPGAAAEAAAQRVHRALEPAFDAGAGELFLDATVGISVFPVDADSAEVLLRNADVAAQQAKRPGLGPSRRFAGETSDKWARLWLAGRLRRAVREGALVVHYQPVVRLDAPTGTSLGDRIVGVEALVRLPLEDGGLAPPARFVPLAEDLGLIERLGEVVFDRLCQDAAVWAARGLRPALACNVSLRELWRPALVERFLRQAAAHGVDPAGVVLEITESSAMTDPVRTARVLRALSGQGFRVAIDDFGAGHSSLARLADLPADVLKLDRLFVARLPDDRAAAALVAAMLELARKLGMQAVAEGIETDQQRRFLVEHGCELGQGFLFSRPVPADVLPAL